MQDEYESSEEEYEVGEMESTQDEEVEEVVEEEVVEKEKPAEEDDGNTFIDFNKIEDVETRKKTQARIAKETREREKQKRDIEKERKRIAELEEKLAEFQKPKDVAAPTYDDFLDDPEGAQRKQQEFAESVASKKEWEWQQQQREQQKQAELAQEQARVHNELFEKAKNAGINENDLRYSAAALANKYSLGTENFLLGHEYAPQLINHLAKNADQAEAIANLSPYQVGVKLNEMAQAFKPKRKSKAPEPDTPLGGSRVNKPAGLHDDLLKGSEIL